jgi:hypothetical protein
MYYKHQNESKGDMSFIEDLLPNNVKIYHMDSYNIDNDRRFQGSFYYDFKGNYVTSNECPLPVLKLARKYQMNICTCKDVPHVTWTIWF